MRDEESIHVYTAEYRFDIERLSSRVVIATDWIHGLPRSAFVADRVLRREHRCRCGIDRRRRTAGALARAVVSRGGRPDLAVPALAKVHAPTVLIVGELDHAVIEMNQDAMSRMEAGQVRELKIVRGATHLFEEPGTRVTVTRLMTRLRAPDGH